jgi:hypothetical protein
MTDMSESMSAIPVWAVALVFAAAAPFLVRALERALERRVRNRTREIFAAFTGMESATHDRRRER